VKTGVGTGVCIIVENLPVPLDRRVWKEACALRDAGYRVSVICPKGKGFTAAYESIDGIEVYRHRMWEAASKYGYFLEYLAALFFEFLLAIKVFFRSRYSILQACNPPDTIFLIGLLMRPLGVRFIFDQHDPSPELFEAKFGNAGHLLHKLTRFFERCSFRLATVCIVTNESFRDIAITRGGKRAEDVFLVRNCPDLSAFGKSETRAGEKRGKEGLVVAYVGFMGTQDGVDLLLDSIEDIVKRQNRRDTHFLLIGGGTILPSLIAAAQEKGIKDFVTFTGQVAHDEVVRYLAGADIGVSPDPKNSLNDILTMVKLFEYMASGLPMVLFDMKEGRRSAGAAALYAVPNDPVDFANQIATLLDSEPLRRQLGECGLGMVRDGLNWENEKQSLLNAYEAALSPACAVTTQ